jgi:hypothetical protein
MFDNSYDEDERLTEIPCPMGQCLIGFLLGSLFGYITYLLAPIGFRIFAVSIAIGLGTTLGLVSSSIPTQNPCDVSCRELVSGFVSTVPVNWFILQYILILSETSWGLPGIILTSMVTTFIQWGIRNVISLGGRSGLSIMHVASPFNICKSLFASSRRGASRSHVHASKSPLDNHV